MAGNVSIHLMLLFIKKFIFITGGKDKFQYISCYSLSGRSVRTNCSLNVSIHLMLLFIGKCKKVKFCYFCFNTSHVTLYRAIHLSRIHKTISFQYISCYSLSSHQSQKTGINACFNTSHVTLYRYMFFLCSLLHRFNTSHVTLYLLCA